MLVKQSPFGVLESLMHSGDHILSFWLLMHLIYDCLLLGTLPLHKTSKLVEDIYMQHHKGFIHDPSLFCRLRKSLYGLKQSPRAWYAKMDNFLLSLGFERCKFDPNVYLHHNGDLL